MDTKADTMRFGIGQGITRKEDQRFLTGRGRYVSDIDRPDQAHAAFVYSPHAHAIIRSIDTAAAQAMPGVIAVLTGRDWLDDDLGTIDPEMMPEDLGGPKGYRTQRLPLATERVRYVGERLIRNHHPLGRIARFHDGPRNHHREALPDIAHPLGGER